MGSVGLQRHRPEQTLLYQIVERYYPAFADHLAEAGKQLPAHVRQAFEGYLQCGRLEHGFIRLRCDTCRAEHLLAFSCKRRGFCPSCGAWSMADGAAWLIDQVLPERPIRQWVSSLPFPLRFLLATHPALIGRVLGFVYRVITGHLIRQTGHTQRSARTNTVADPEAGELVGSPLIAGQFRHCLDFGLSVGHGRFIL